MPGRGTALEDISQSKFASIVTQAWDFTPCDIMGWLIAVFIMTQVLSKLLLNMSQLKDSFIGSKIFSDLVGHHREDRMSRIEEMITVVQLATKMNKLK